MVQKTKEDSSKPHRISDIVYRDKALKATHIPQVVVIVKITKSNVKNCDCNHECMLHLCLRSVKSFGE
jgi:hypothetical protein